jgi:hypothetical protein
MRICKVPRWLDDATDIFEYLDRSLVGRTKSADESL